MHKSKPIVRKNLKKSAPVRDSLKSRLQLRDHFFSSQIDAKQLLAPFNQIPGVLYFVKDTESRLMAMSRDAMTRLGFQSESEIIGKHLHHYLPADIADKYRADDLKVLTTGEPLLNIVEMYYNERGVYDWIITDKYPLRDSRGKIVGLIGTVQTFEGRRKLLSHLGPVGKAADYIRDHLGESLMLPEIARHTGFSERQLQRLFLRVFGITMHQFIIRSRVQAAIRELIHSDRPISEIALMFGFSDQSAFTNQFRDITGMPPRAYRKRYFAHFTP